MPMEPPTKKRRYLKGMELAEADREQSPRGPPKSLRHFIVQRAPFFTPFSEDAKNLAADSNQSLNTDLKIRTG